VVPILVEHEEGNQSRPVTALTLGGVTATLYGRGVGGTGANNCYVELWYILETLISSILTDPVLTITPSASGTSVQAITVYTLTGCDQNPANWTSTPSNVWSDVSVALSSSLTTTTGGVVIGGMVCSTSGFGFATDSPLIEVTGSDRSFNSASRAVAFYYDVTSGGTLAVGGDNSASSGTQLIYAVNIPQYAAVTPTLSDGTPSGTLSTQGQATLGATTTQNNGTLYAVVSSTQSDITGVTAAQVKAAQYSGGGAATLHNSAAISTTSPSVSITGLTANTTYYFALAQNATSGDSNVITGSFTTAVASTTVSQTMVSSDGVTPLNGVTRRFWTKTSLYGSAYDGGTSGLAITCNSSGVFTLTGLTVPAGAGYLTYHDPADNTKSINIPVTFVASA